MEVNKTIKIILFLFVGVSIVIAQTRGNASYYSNKMQGKRTASGERYHKDSLTCAHLTYPFGTMLKVRNLKNDKEVIVKVTDRGPHNRHLMIDLSYSAAQQLDMIRAGVVPVEITRVDSIPILFDIQADSLKKI